MHPLKLLVRDDLIKSIFGNKYYYYGQCSISGFVKRKAIRCP